MTDRPIHKNYLFDTYSDILIFVKSAFGAKFAKYFVKTGDVTMKLLKSLAERLSGSIFGVDDTIAIEIVTYQDDMEIDNRIVALHEYL